MTIPGYPHIELNEKGVPCIAGTRMKVKFIAIQRTAWALHAEQIQRQYPHLSLAQIHGALAYYYDHQEAIDHTIAEDERIAEELRPRLEDPALVAKLRAIKRSLAESPDLPSDLTP